MRQMTSLRSAVYCAFALIFSTTLGAQTLPNNTLLSPSDIPLNPADFASSANREIKITQRWDFRVNVNGKPNGMVYGYNQGTWLINPPASDGSSTVEARYFLTEEAAQDLAHKEKGLDAELKTTFVLAADGSVKRAPNGAVPFHRGFPPIPPAGAVPGTKWEGQAQLAIDPNHSGIWTIIPLNIEYKMMEPATWQGRTVTDIRAKYAVRFRKDRIPTKDTNLVNAEGTRDATIYLDPLTNFPVFIRELVGHETWTFADGKKVVEDGFILTFYDGGAPLTVSVAEKRRDESNDIRKKLEKDQVQDVKVRNDEKGVTLTLDNLRFVADSPDLLPGEEARLDRIATALKAVSSTRSLLVVGHTADVGTVESQKSLSVERAKRIVEALKNRGIDPGRLLFDGRGGTQPVGDNTSEEGRAKNRRVEITILD